MNENNLILIWTKWHLIWVKNYLVLWDGHKIYIRMAIACEMKSMMFIFMWKWIHDTFCTQSACSCYDVSYYIFCALIILHRGRKGILKHLARDKVTIARYISSILIYEIIHLMHYCMYWLMACGPTRFDTDIKFYIHIAWWYMVDDTFTLGLIMS